jgi:hypothetical protein
MLTILFIILAVLTPYLAVGARVARNRYAVESHNYRAALARAQSPDAQRDAAKKELSKLKLQKANLPHKSYCYLNYPNLSRDGCSNCDSSGKWHRLSERIAELEKTGRVEIVVSEPAVPYRTMVTWPVVKLGDYLTSGKVERADPFIIAELERLTGIKELP